MSDNLPHFLAIEQFLSKNRALLPQGDANFKLTSDYTPKGDQPNAIYDLTKGVKEGERNQVLLGVTGSGKTFTIAHVIQNLKRPALVLAPNKTLAAQLYGEMKSFFPENAVEYFVSYYDYYQPEAYIPRSDTFIEKEATINEQIDRMRHSATRSMLERRDVIAVASVSCIYGIGGVETYANMILRLKKGIKMDRNVLLKHLVDLQYKRNDLDFSRGNFRVRGDNVEIFPAHYEDRGWRLSFFGDELESLQEIDALTGKKTTNLDDITIYPNSHHVTPRPTLMQAISFIKEDLEKRVQEFYSQGKLIEAQRIRERVIYDIEMMVATGSCPGIENYSRYLTGRNIGDPPPTLFEYLAQDAIHIVDESHVAIPQLFGMYRGDAARKKTLSEFGFRLPACADNRPLKFEEWEMMRPQTIFVSATPGPWELQQTNGVFTEQIIRPTGLIDPIPIIRPVTNQVDDLIGECKEVIAKGQRILVTTLTKKMAEDLTDYMKELGIKVAYIHSDVQTLDRIEIIRDLRLGKYDVIVGINLLREGLDIPECGLVAILDADKEGFLRSKTSLIQTMGRAARNVFGRAILYADKITKSIEAAQSEALRRREKQLEYNLANNITPESIQKNIRDIMNSPYEKGDHLNVDISGLSGFKNQAEIHKHIAKLEKQMKKAANDLDFEEATKLRDEIRRLEKEAMIFGEVV